MEKETVTGPVKTEAKPVAQVCNLERVLEGLAVEGSSEEESQHLRRVFLLYGLRYLNEDTFDKEIRRFTKKGFSQRLLKNGTHLAEQLGTISKAVFDYKHFNTPITEALKEHQEVDGTVNRDKEMAYILKHIDLSTLDVDDCLLSVEDLDPSTIRNRIPGGVRIETTSKFGKAVETLIHFYGKPNYNDEIRKAFCGKAAGLLNRVSFDEMLAPHRKLFKKLPYDNVMDRITDNLFELYNKIVIYDYEPLMVATWLSKLRPPVTLADWEYLNKVLGKVDKKDLLYADQVMPLTDEELTSAKSLVSYNKVRINNVKNNVKPTMDQ
jgi:hypothetical protein